MEEPGDVTLLLQQVRGGESDASGRLFELLYGELRFFGGLTTREVAEVLGRSTRAIELDWTMAKDWLARRLGPDA